MVMLMSTESGMGIEDELLIASRSDNIGSVFMADNSRSDVHTRHVDTRDHFIPDYVEDDCIKVIFARSDENEADIFTKNVSKDTYEKHERELLG